MLFKKKMPEDYYSLKMVKEFEDNNEIKVNYGNPIYQRNEPKKYKLTLNHVELIEYFVRMIKPNNFLELGVQYGEATLRILPHIKGKYIAVDIERDENIDFFEERYKNFAFVKTTTDDFFRTLNESNTNLEIEMAFIDACHTFDASYRDFLNIRRHMKNDGIIFMHDTYPKDVESTGNDLSGDCYKTAERIRGKHSNEFEIITIPVEPGLSILRKIDRQLDWIPSSYGFIIPSYIADYSHVLVLERCIKSLEYMHPLQKKIVIVDFKSNKTLINVVTSLNHNKNNIIFELSDENITAEMLSLYYYRKNRYFEKAIIIQDSMSLKEKIDVSKVEDVLYMMYFTNHRVHWHTIKEPETEYNISNNILTHDDLVVDKINKIYSEKEKYKSFKDYFDSIYFTKSEWCGCFGGCCIITYDFLEKLDNITGIINFGRKMIDKRDRMVFESVFSIACQYITKRNMEIGYDGLYYDGYGIPRLEGDLIDKLSLGR